MILLKKKYLHAQFIGKKVKIATDDADSAIS